MTKTVRLCILIAAMLAVAEAGEAAPRFVVPPRLRIQSELLHAKRSDEIQPAAAREHGERLDEPTAPGAQPAPSRIDRFVADYVWPTIRRLVVAVTDVSRRSGALLAMVANDSTLPPMTNEPESTGRVE